MAALVVAAVGLAIVATTPDRAAVRVAAVAALVATTVVLPVAPAPEPASAQVLANGCEAGAPTRSYDVAAINVNMVLNRYGDHDPLGMMYVLESDIPAVRAQEASGDVTAGLRDDPIQALAIRANAGECLTINFTNRLSNGMPASFHLTGLAYTATNDGGEVGNNPGTPRRTGEGVFESRGVGGQGGEDPPGDPRGREALAAAGEGTAGRDPSLGEAARRLSGRECRA